METKKIYTIDSIDEYNKSYNLPTLHPLVAIVYLHSIPEWMNGATAQHHIQDALILPAKHLLRTTPNAFRHTA